MNRISRASLLVVVVLLAMAVLTACGATPTPTAVPTQAPTVAAPTQVPPTQVPPTKVPPTATSVPPTATKVPPTATPKGPTVGGKLVIAYNAEPETLNPLNVVSGQADGITALLNGALVDMAPDGKFVPYLAESWKASPDGLVWDFTIRKGIKFHDGTPCTAKDLAWTFTFGLDPNNKLPVKDTALGSIKTAVAVDDYTLRLTLTARNYAFLVPLFDAGRAAPVPQAAYQKAGTQFGRQPIGVGPYKLKEWKTGQSMTFERNPDFQWAPAHAHQGPVYIQTLELRFIPEYSTILAGLETGEIDMMGSTQSLDAKDVDRIKNTNKFAIFEGTVQGNVPSLWMNITKPPFDDIRVRKAMNLAVDRQALIKATVLGAGVEQRSPLSASVIGYWPGAEQIGYGFDLALAKSLMKDAGFAPGADGILAKGSIAMKFDFPVSSIDYRPKVAEVLKEQYKALGVEINIQLIEHAQLVAKIRKGDYGFALWGAWYPEAWVDFLTFHSSMAGGGWNVGQVKDPDLDKLLEGQMSASDATQYQQAVNGAVKRIIEQAYMVPLFAPKVFVPLSTKFKGAVFAPSVNSVYLFDAYLQ